MKVGDAVTYLDPNGKSQNALVAKISGDFANLVVIPIDGADDHFGKNRAELRDVPIGNVPGCCMTRTAAAKRAKRIAEEEEAANLAAEAADKAKDEAESKKQK